jgi:hypothetical protein
MIVAKVDCESTPRAVAAGATIMPVHGTVLIVEDDTACHHSEWRRRPKKSSSPRAPNY